MKSFKHYITERLAIEDNPNTFTPQPWSARQSRRDAAFERRQAARYGGVMARLAAKALADAQKRTRDDKPFPWSGKSASWGAAPIPGWWRGRGEWFQFSPLNGYHVTRIAQTPEKFGLSRADLLKGAEADAQQRNAAWRHGSGEAWYDDEGTEFPWTAERVLTAIQKSDIDLSYDVQRLAYMRGWLKVYGKTKPHVEGMSRLAIKAALREIADTRGEDTEVEVVFTGFTRGTDRQKYMRARDWNIL